MVPTTLAVDVAATVESSSISAARVDSAECCKKRCRKVVEHSSGNGHVFNMAKVIAFKSRDVNKSNCLLDEDDWGSNSSRKNSYEVESNRTGEPVETGEDHKPPSLGGATNNESTNNSNGQTTPDELDKQPRRRNIMLKEKINFFNRKDETMIEIKKPQFLFRK